METNQIPAQTKPQRKQKILFTQEEDQKLRQLVEEKGSHAWHEIQELMPNRTARQCRERWNLYLSPDVNNTPWTHNEEIQLLKIYQTTGPKWSVIAKNFPNRTPNNVKNHIKQFMRRSQKLYGNPNLIPIQPPVPTESIVIEQPVKEESSVQEQPQENNQ
ncbi:Myb-like DNA-binding domain containing protein [Histomonas meleagridis]|uniref:Myb-like DNA-binding domain containing protein n=1 Tax=Histomonas meleagridis TaxID=135588 RepID=UPI0035598EAB|nr:Myb-like DNA-binding domain containing protein [Histomonas meleagridis]KAH0798548.1 Myb-like DNA-binding domain containing protein [Histomonas meleagridis]